MKFCLDCGNLLLPKDKKLYCRVCNIYYKLDSNVKYEYVLEKTMGHNEKEFTPIITKEPLEEDRITHEDRKTHEDYFNS